MGMRVLESALVDLQDVRVGAEAVVGDVGQAAKYWHAARVRAAISGAAGMVGLAKGGVRDMIG
jgi:alkylation response protein AidB-like acyl-CoA dehydrogenase